MEDVFSFILSQLSKAYSVMRSFELMGGLTLFDFFVILLILNVVITLFVPLFDKHRSSGSADKTVRKGKDK